MLASPPLSESETPITQVLLTLPSPVPGSATPVSAMPPSIGGFVPSFFAEHAALAALAAAAESPRPMTYAQAALLIANPPPSISRQAKRAHFNPSLRLTFSPAFTVTG